MKSQQRNGLIESERFLGDVHNPMAIENHIVRSLSIALGARLTAADVKSLEVPATSNADAYDLFLKAKTHFDRITSDNARRLLTFWQVRASPSPLRVN